MRKHTRIVQVGNLFLGGDNPIYIQSMTNTRTKNIEATVAQILELENAGCEIIRVAVLDEDDARAIKEIKTKINIPIVADIHFNYRLALIAVESGVDKLRINPGNIGDIERVKAVVEACKLHNIPIRIGVNSGSLEKDLAIKYKDDIPTALVESARRHVQILEDLDFHNIVLSLKASNTKTAIEAYTKASNEFPYPLHIGITEAGTKFTGTVKSAIGLGILLHQGIGDTLRVSLSTNPVEEITVAKEILATFGLYTKPTIIACPTCGRLQYDMLNIVNEIEEYVNTLPNIDLKIAIMGCAVNGPGEARDADIGIAGGKNGALLFKKGEIVRRIEQENIVSELKIEIEEYIKNEGKN